MNHPPDDPGRIEEERQDRQRRYRQLHDYTQEYTLDQFIEDLQGYFDGQVDFNLEKIRAVVGKPGKLSQLIQRAREHRTHPVSEFVQDMVTNATQDKNI
ncbi:MAG: hypothetical protein GF333_00535 [Candidatus Omnitrophica bacterium]|nr:hypothetical protein [Candidatus Omnitrophota bacterium]